VDKESRSMLKVLIKCCDANASTSKDFFEKEQWKTIKDGLLHIKEVENINFD
jgi:hypothetical protein